MSLYVNQRRVEPAADTVNDSGETKAAAAAGSPAGSRRFTNFPMPQKLLKDRRLVVAWSDPNELRTPGLRYGPCVAEVWLLKKQQARVKGE